MTVQIAIASGVIKSGQLTSYDVNSNNLQNDIDNKHPSSNHPAYKALINKKKDKINQT